MNSLRTLVLTNPYSRPAVPNFSCGSERQVPSSAYLPHFAFEMFNHLLHELFKNSSFGQSIFTHCSSQISVAVQNGKCPALLTCRSLLSKCLPANHLPHELLRTLNFANPYSCSAVLQFQLRFRTASGQLCLLAEVHF